MKAQYFLLILTIVTFYFLVKLFNPFLTPLIVALLLAVATHSFYIYIKNRVKSAFISSFIMTIFLTAIFFVPILYCIFSFASLINQIDQQALVQIFDIVQTWVKNIPDDFIFIKDNLNMVLQKINIQEYIQYLISFGAYLGKNSAAFIINMIMILIFYFFFNFYGISLSYTIKDMLPLKKDDANELFYESSNVMSVVLYSILVTAVFEGVLFGVFVTFFSYDGILLGVLYGFASLIPVFGGIIMWVPVVIYEAVTGTLTNAIIIAVYSVLIISIIADTFIKPMIIKYINEKIVKTPTVINELLIFFSIVAGLSTFGFWGMILGPAMVTFFISLIKLLKKFYVFDEDNKK